MKAGEEIPYYHTPASLYSHKIVVVDCDDTLVLWDKSEYPHAPRIEIEYSGHVSELVIHEKNRNVLIKLAKLGYTIIVWSATGYDWAEKVVEALKLEPYVSLCLSKPRYYIDDKEATEWIGPRIWRENK